MTNKLIASVNLFLEDSGEISVKLDIDYTNEANIEVFKKVIKEFAEDSQKLKVEHFKQVTATKEQIRVNTVERINELLQDVKDEKILNKMVPSFKDVVDNIVASDAEFKAEDEICKKEECL